MRLLSILFCITVGALNVWGTVTNQPWMLSGRRRQRMAQMFGEGFTKGFYFVIGILLVILGLMALFH